MRIIVSALLLICISTTLSAQKNNINLSKEEIIQKSWKAMFGDLASDDLKSIYVESFYHGKDIPNKTTIERPNKSRNITTSGIQVFDGQRAAWEQRTPDKEGNLRNPELITAEHWKHFEVDIALLFPAYFDYPSIFKGLNIHDGVMSYAIYVELPLGSHITYFIDPNSFLITRRIASWNGSTTEGLFETQLHDYANYGGINYPEYFSFEWKDETQKAYYKNFKINVPTNSDLFDIPEGL